MRILLDAKDLIDLVEHGSPVGLNDLISWLNQQNARLVLTATNVCELVAPLKVRGDFLEIRRWLQELEDAPVCYLREGYIILQELQAATDAFRDGSEFQAPDAYVGRWDEVIQPPGRSVSQGIVRYRLHETIYDVWKTASLFDFRSHTQALNRLFQADRAIPKKSLPSLEENFVETVKRNLHLYRLTMPNVDQLAKWIWADPARCPGLRLGYEVFHQLERNVCEVALSGDIPDFNHIRAIPYVDSITVDRRMAHYCRTVIRQLKQLNPMLDYEERISVNLRKLLAGSSRQNATAN
jgi:hypothetical protein